MRETETKHVSKKNVSTTGLGNETIGDLPGGSMSDQVIRELLKNSKKIAVVGLSPVPARPSFGVTRYMIGHGYEIFGIRPASPPKILDRPCFESLRDLREDVDIIDVFRNPDSIPQVVAEVEAWLKSGRKAKALWLQEGISHPAAEKKAEDLGLQVISNKCILKEHARLL